MDWESAPSVVTDTLEALPWLNWPKPPVPPSDPPEVGLPSPYGPHSRLRRGCGPTGGFLRHGLSLTTSPISLATKVAGTRKR